MEDILLTYYTILIKIAMRLIMFIFNSLLQPILVMTKIIFYVLFLKPKIEDRNLRHFSKLKITFLFERAYT